MGGSSHCACTAASGACRTRAADAFSGRGPPAGASCSPLGDKVARPLAAHKVPAYVSGGHSSPMPASGRYSSKTRSPEVTVLSQALCSKPAPPAGSSVRPAALAVRGCDWASAAASARSAARPGVMGLRDSDSAPAAELGVMGVRGSDSASAAEPSVMGVRGSDSASAAEPSVMGVRGSDLASAAASAAEPGAPALCGGDSASTAGTARSAARPGVVELRGCALAASANPTAPASSPGLRKCECDPAAEAGVGAPPPVACAQAAALCARRPPPPTSMNSGRNMANDPTQSGGVSFI